MATIDRLYGTGVDSPVQTTWSDDIGNADSFEGQQIYFSDIRDIIYSNGTDYIFPDYIKLPKFNIAVNSAVWRYTLSGTEPLDNSYWVYTPINTTGDFTFFAVGKFSTSRNLGRMGVGRIGTQLWNDAGAGVTKVGTWTASTPAGAYKANTWSSTSGETISFAVTGHTLVSRSTTSTNAGYAIVGIDGNYTGAANRLPLFTAADFAASRCRETDVGKTYINTYNSGIIQDRHLMIADNLTDGAHTVTFEATGTKIAASSGTRAYIGGVIGCSSTDAGQTINGTRVVAHIIALNGGGSAMLMTPEVDKAGSVFVGDTTSTSTTLTISSVTSGTVAVGQTVTGTGVPPNTTISSFGTFTVVAGFGTIILSRAATATNAGVTFTGNRVYEFLGDVHGAETEESFTLYVDGIDSTDLTAGSYLSASTNITIETISTIASTDATGTPVFRKKHLYTWSTSNSLNQLTANCEMTCLVEKRVRANYPLMIPIGETNVAGSPGTINNWWDKCLFGTYSTVESDFTTNGGANNGKVPGIRAIIKSSKHNYEAVGEFTDGGALMNYFSRSAPLNIMLNDRADGFDKIYFNRSNSFNNETFSVGDVIKGAIGFSIRKYG